MKTQRLVQACLGIGALLHKLAGEYGDVLLMSIYTTFVVLLVATLQPEGEERKSND